MCGIIKSVLFEQHIPNSYLQDAYGIVKIVPIHENEETY